MQEEELQNLLMKLLHSIRLGDWETYIELTDENLTCFEPETNGHPVYGLPFHKFFFDNPGEKTPYHLELVNPTYRIYGDVAYVMYTLLISKFADGKASVSSVNETRIFNKKTGTWKMVHFHRS
ncbi:MAG: DUF4440 domain-containing protein [Candidatus Kariarchaeaceae archaeon]|jgi:calcium/calmodulin-dependent protein kinase (CaM kinase) II